MPDNKISKAEVSIVISTYNRPEILRSCIKAVLLQSISNWQLFVLGDCCDSKTEAVIKEFNDNRIIYYNNTFRFGEQSGGNSLGIALAETPYIAFLNHDDLWMPNHLEVALDCLNRSKDDFYISKSIFSDKCLDSIPIFDYITNPKRKPSWTFTAHFHHFEPCSSWVIKTSFAKKIGYWKPSYELYRRPIQDYIMRAWKDKAKFYFGTHVTCFHISTHNAIQKDVYSYAGDENKYLLDIIKRPEKLKELIANDKLNETKYNKNYKAGSNKFRQIGYKIVHDFFINKITAYIYYFTGVDCFNILHKLLLLKKGEDSRKTLERRTGEKTFIKYNLFLAINEAKTQIQGTDEYSELD